MSYWQKGGFYAKLHKMQFDKEKACWLVASLIAKEAYIYKQKVYCYGRKYKFTNEPEPDYEKAEMDQLRDALKRTHKERFLMITTL